MSPKAGAIYQINFRFGTQILCTSCKDTNYISTVKVPVVAVHGSLFLEHEKQFPSFPTETLANL